MNSRESRRAEVGPLLTVAEVADVLRVSNMTVYRLIKAGDISALRVGKNYRIRQQELEGYLAQGSVAADEANG
jgi:excisionase family DNA binding protein